MVKIQHYLILHQNFHVKVAKYPAINLSAMDKQDRGKMLSLLNKYSGSGIPESPDQ